METKTFCFLSQRALNVLQLGPRKQQRELPQLLGGERRQGGSAGSVCAVCRCPQLGGEPHSQCCHIRPHLPVSNSHLSVFLSLGEVMLDFTSAVDIAHTRTEVRGRRPSASVLQRRFPLQSVSTLGSTCVHHYVADGGTDIQNGSP